MDALGVECMVRLREELPAALTTQQLFEQVYAEHVDWLRKHLLPASQR